MPTDGTANPKTSRRLAAILAADRAGYSALMGADEDATVRGLKAHQAHLPMIGKYGGRLIDTAGAGILAEFPSVGNALEGSCRPESNVRAQYQHSSGTPDALSHCQPRRRDSRRATRLRRFFKLIENAEHFLDGMRKSGLPER